MNCLSFYLKINPAIAVNIIIVCKTYMMTTMKNGMLANVIWMVSLLT